MACNLVLSELEDASADEQLTKRIKAIVKRILAKAKQANAVVLNLVSVHLGCSHANQSFIDLHKESLSPKKSWHFKVNEIDSPKTEAIHLEENVYERIETKLSAIKHQHLL